MWDCDCRPSDATFLAMKAGAPIHVNKRVWNEASTRLKDTHAFEYIRQLHAQGAGKEAAAAPAAAAPRLGGGGGGGGGSGSSSGSDTPAASGAATPSEAPDSSMLLPIHLLLRDMEARAPRSSPGAPHRRRAPARAGRGARASAPGARTAAPSPRRAPQEAVAQEDYGLAAQLRDHPWMRIHADIETSKCARRPGRGPRPRRGSRPRRAAPRRAARPWARPRARASRAAPLPRGPRPGAPARSTARRSCTCS